MLDLSAPRDLGDILSGCWQLYRRHFLVFATVALAVVLPLDVITLGFFDGQLTGEFDSDNIASGGVAYDLVQALITTPLITAGHVFAVMQVGRGETPAAGSSLIHAAGVLPVLIGVVFLTLVFTVLGTLALILPGVYISVKLVVAAQAAAAEDDLGVIESLRRSWDLVKDNWWRAFGIYIVLYILAALAGVLVGLPVGAIAAAADSGALLVFATVLMDAAILSFTALGGTLLFFDLRARHAGTPAVPTPSTPAPPERPEAP